MKQRIAAAVFIAGKSLFFMPNQDFFQYLSPEICLIMSQSKNEMSGVYFGIAIKGKVGVTAFTFTQLHLFNSQDQIKMYKWKGLLIVRLLVLYSLF